MHAHNRAGSNDQLNHSTPISAQRKDPSVLARGLVALNLGHRLSQGIEERALPQHRDDTGVVEHGAHLGAQMRDEQGDAAILQRYTSSTTLVRLAIIHVPGKFQADRGRFAPP